MTSPSDPAADLAFSASHFQALLEEAFDGIFVRRGDTLVYVNPALLRLLGYEHAEELVGRPVLAFIHPEHHALLRERIRMTNQGQGSEPPISVRCIRRDGGTVWLDGAGMPAKYQDEWAYLVLVRDVTAQRQRELLLRATHETLGARLGAQEEELERARVAAQREADLRQRAEEQLRQAQKMDAVGRLAGGIAHDFNNLLTVILAHASALQGSLDPGDARQENATELVVAGQRAADLTRQLLALSRRQVLEPRVVDVNALVERMSSMLSRLVGEHIAISAQLGTDVPTIRIDPTQLEQVVLNLVVNARDAMPHGGRIGIDTSATLVDVDGSQQLGLAEGPYVRLDVSDSGVGMDEETRAHIFEPFFTTKEAGSGVGLGLSTVHGIVHQSGGTIQVESSPGQGARFCVYLPVSAVSAEQEEPRPQEGKRAGNETIVVAEDEPAVLRVICEVLAGAGYRVLAGADGAEALAAAQSHDGPIHLLLTDFIMPGMTGVELARHMLASHPELHVLVVSGYSRYDQLPASMSFLQKPFTEDDLLDMVRDVLDDPAPREEANLGS